MGSCENNIVVETCEISVFFYKPCFVKLKEEKILNKEEIILKRRRRNTSLIKMWTSNLVILLALIIQGSSGIQWLALSKFSAVGTEQAMDSDGASPDKMCNSMKGSLIKKQVSFCKRNPTFMESVRLGAARAVDECQFQFRSRRWNCSTLDDSIGKKMDLITTSLNQLTAHHGNSESSNNHKGGGLNLHLPSGGGGGHGGFNPNNGLNPFSNPYMHNSMYRPNDYGNQQRSSNDRSSRQVQQAFNRRNDRNDRNVRRGRRLSRRADSYFDDGFPASSSAPPSWRPPLNATSMMGPGIPLNSFEKYLPNLDHLNLNQNLDGDDDENEIGNN